MVGVFSGGAWAGFNAANDHGGWSSGGGLIALMVLIAGIALLFTGRYPRSIFDFIMGMNRWAFRVCAYATLMTDAYPPFRLDMGGPESAPEAPGTDAVAAAPAVLRRRLAQRKASAWAAAHCSKVRGSRPRTSRTVGLDLRLVEGAVDVEVEEGVDVLDRHLGAHLRPGLVVGQRLEA